MDIIGNEVTQRIRAAITNKLKDVGVYVDDELPDYIMVMVANKKSKEQMMTDLMLFLGTSTESFTRWLHELLDNLQATTSMETVKPLPSIKEEEINTGPEILPFEVEQPEVPVLPPTAIEDDNEEVLTFQADLEADDILLQELQKEEIHHIPKPEVKSSKIFLKNISPVRSPEKLGLPAKSSAKVRPIFHKRIAPQSTIHRPLKSYQNNLSNENDDDSDEKYDPRNPAVGNVASIVRVTERKSSVPKALQANKLLLFKAMEDANKSVTYTHKKSQVVQFEPYEPTPIAKLKKPVQKVISQAVEEPKHVMITGNIQPMYLGEEEPTHYLVDDQIPKEIHIPVVSSKSTLLPLKRKMILEPEIKQEVLAKNPRFVVTLDGVDPAEFMSIKSLRSVVSQKPIPDDEELNEEEDEEMPDLEDEENFAQMDQYQEEDCISDDRERLPVRCRQWPACPRGDTCQFHHPTVHCKMFPKCTFGKKCLYIHPNCKYDSICSKNDCPFTHASKRHCPLAPPIPICLTSELIAGPSRNSTCKFYPNCLNRSCPFFHPKNCKFGLQCKNPSCQFTHPTSVVASPSQLKWTAPKTLSNRNFSIPGAAERIPVQIKK